MANFNKEILFSHIRHQNGCAMIVIPEFDTFITSWEYKQIYIYKYVELEDWMGFVFLNLFRLSP